MFALYGNSRFLSKQDSDRYGDRRYGRTAHRSIRTATRHFQRCHYGHWRKVFHPSAARSYFGVFLCRHGKASRQSRQPECYRRADERRFTDACRNGRHRVRQRQETRPHRVYHQHKRRWDCQQTRSQPGSRLAGKDSRRTGYQFWQGRSRSWNTCARYKLH